MYMRGLNDVFDTWEADQAPIPESVLYPTTTPVWPASPGFDWTGTLNTVIKTYGDIQNRDAQMEIEKMRIQAQARNPFYYNALSPASYGNPALNPFTGAGGSLFGLSPNTIIVIGAAIAAMLILKKKGR